MPKLKRKSDLQKLAESRKKGKRRRAALSAPTEEESLDCQNTDEDESNISTVPDVILEDTENLNEVSLIPETISSHTDKITAERNVELTQLEKPNAEQNKKKAEYMRSRRQDPEVRTPEKKRNAVSMRLRREEPEVRTPEKERNAVSMRLRREDPEVRTPEKERNAESMRLRREDPTARISERTRNAEIKRSRRQDEIVRVQEKLAYRKKKSDEVSSYDKLLNKYIPKIRQAPTFICSCCGALCYEESTSITTKEELREKGCSEEFVKAVLHYNQDIHRVCCTCKSYVFRKDNKKLPRVALANGLEFPDIPDRLKVKHERELIFFNI